MIEREDKRVLTWAHGGGRAARHPPDAGDDLASKRPEDPSLRAQASHSRPGAGLAPAEPAVRWTMPRRASPSVALASRA